MRPTVARVNRDQRGVSLIELLVGIVVFALLFLMIDSVFISAHRSARKAELGADVQQNARIAVERVTREIRESQESTIAIDPSGTWVAFKSARLPEDSGVFCLNVSFGPLSDARCAGVTGTNTFVPLWQRWIVYWFDAGAGVLRRAVQDIASVPAPTGGNAVAASVQSFDARCSGVPVPFLDGPTFCVRLVVEGREVVQGSDVPPQEIILQSRTLIRN